MKNQGNFTLAKLHSSSMTKSKENRLADILDNEFKVYFWNTPWPQREIKQTDKWG
jgi:hypothetical protein